MKYLVYTTILSAYNRVTCFNNLILLSPIITNYRLVIKLFKNELKLYHVHLSVISVVIRGELDLTRTVLTPAHVAASRARRRSPTPADPSEATGCRR